MLVAKPFMTQRELAAHFGVSENWMSQVVRSDAFRARLAEEKEKHWSPILATNAEKLEALAAASLDKLLEKVQGPAAMPTDKLLVETAKLTTAALGYGARPSGERSGPAAQVIINLPAKAPDEKSWATRHAPSPGGIIDVPSEGSGTPAPT